jgi:hypothetical protein
MCKHHIVSNIFEIHKNYLGVLSHKKCTNLVYAKVSDVSKKENSEEMTTKVNLLKDFQLQTESNLSFILYSTESKYISGYQKVNQNNFF